jgi:arylsulfatase A-like enzyme
MSGTSPAANGATGFASPEWNNINTLPGELSKNGYQTYHIGKMHIKSKEPYDKERFGFDHCEWNEQYNDWLREVHGRTETGLDRAHGSGVNSWVGRPSHLPEEQMHTFWCFERALRFLKYRDTSVPFFLKISVTDPHPPLTPPKVFYDRYVNKDLPKPFVGDWAGTFDKPQKGLETDARDICLGDDEMQYMRAAYYGMINFIDCQIGRFMAAANSILKNTMFVFVSDHGEMLGDHQRFCKLVPYESSARIPFIIAPPKGWDVEKGVVSDCPAGLQDVMPTFLDAAGIDVPDTCTGKSLMPIVRGEKDRVRDVLHGEHCGSVSYNIENGHHYLVDERYKYIWFSQTGRELFFDLKEDPQELHNLASESDAEEKLQPWREKLIEILKGRPEGFTDGEKLIVGRPHEAVIPGYDPDVTRKFL